MAKRILLEKWIQENPLGTLDDWKKAVGKVSAQEEAFFATRENIAKNMNSGTNNDKGDSSLAGNPGALAVVQTLDNLKSEPSTDENKAKIFKFQSEVPKRLEGLKGKNKEEQIEAVADLLPKKERGEVSLPIPQAETAPKIENGKTPLSERQAEINEKSNSLLKAWASTHPSWAKILKSKDLTFGQKVQLVGSALANIGANVTFGAKAGFEHSGFQPIEWDFKKAVDKYSDQEIEKVLGTEQNTKAKFSAGEFINDYKKTHGEEATNDLITTLDLFGDNPAILQSRLKSMGISLNAEELKTLYAEAEKTEVTESMKQKALDTEAKRLANRIQQLQAKVTGETAEKLIKAQNALNNFNEIKYNSDGKTYNIEKAGNYLKNIIHEVEGVASTVGGIATGGVVGGASAIKDGIVKAGGIPQKIVRADGTEIELSPYDNIYATENPLTTEKDNGEKIVPMSRDDEVITIQKKLGYNGGFINKDFNYYLARLRG